MCISLLSVFPHYNEPNSDLTYVPNRIVCSYTSNTHKNVHNSPTWETAQMFINYFIAMKMNELWYMPTWVNPRNIMLKKDPEYFMLLKKAILNGNVRIRSSGSLGMGRPRWPSEVLFLERGREIV